MFDKIAEVSIVNAGIAIVLGFLLSALLGKLILPLLSRLHVGQKVRSDGPKSHYVKSGTPTFGGMIFLIAFSILANVYMLFHFSWQALAIYLFILTHALVGFADDYVKVRIDKAGLSPRHKTILLLIVESIFLLFYLFVLQDQVRFILPFGLGVWTIQGIWKIFYALFLLFYFYACTNAVNITDGVDGLASSVSVVSFLFIAATQFLRNDAAGSSMSFWYACSFAGALLGFLLYNWHKAKVFMGDFGSLAIGAAVSILLLQEEIPLAFVLTGVIYLIEIASVFIQVQYFRRTGGKRIFRMSPIHHHFELGNWSEVRIVWTFVAVQIIGSVLAALFFWPGM